MRHSSVDGGGKDEGSRAKSSHLEREAWVGPVSQIVEAAPLVFGSVSGCVVVAVGGPLLRLHAEIGVRVSLIFLCLVLDKECTARFISFIRVWSRGEYLRIAIIICRLW